MTKLFMQIVVLLLTGLLCLPAVPSADTAQYFYDELGRLVGVVDGSGNVAVYVYDEVGNLLRIDRPGTGGQQIGIFFHTPSKGLVNTDVTIKGFGFSATPSANEVQFNGVAATVVSATTDTLVATVPGSATTGSVTVTNANGTATSPQAFTVLVPPIISGVQPTAAPQSATTPMVIDGFNLASATAVTFTQAGLTATIQPGSTDDQLKISLVVGGTVPAGTYPFSVVTPGGTAQSGTVTVEVKVPFPVFNVGKGTVRKSGPPNGTNFSLTKATVHKEP